MSKFAVLLLTVPVLVGLGALLFLRDDKPKGIPAASETDREIWLFTQGFKGELTDTQELIVPSPEDAVFAEYAAMQAAQGYPLAQYAGQSACRYTYRLTTGGLYAELLCADGILIGAMCFDPVTHRMYGADGKPYTS